MPVLDTCTELIKSHLKSQRHYFLHCKSTGAFDCHGDNNNFDSVCPKTICSFSPTPLMLHLIFDHDWPTGLRYSCLKVLEYGEVFGILIVSSHFDGISPFFPCKERGGGWGTLISKNMISFNFTL